MTFQEQEHEQSQYMNRVTQYLAGAAIVLGFAAQHVIGQGAQGAQITKRARDVVNQNNVRQGVAQPSRPPGAPPASQSGQKAATGSVQTHQQSVTAIRAEIASILGSTQLSQEKVQEFSACLKRAARGPKRPSPVAIDKLAGNIATNLSAQTLGSSEQSRLAEDLEAIVNASNMSQLQADAYVADVQAILEVAGVKRTVAVSTAGDVKTVLSELRH
jgi:hypothetical protein